MKIDSIAPQNLEERFSKPEGWRWGTLKREGRTIRYGVSFPKDSTPDVIVVCLPGLSEFGEKYFEVARNLNDKNMAFWVIDWVGHGKSNRYFDKQPHKRHSAGFQNDVEDLNALYEDYIKHSSVHPDVGRIPRAMLAHSMGGNIGLHYLKQYPDTFDCAFFSTPMFGLQATNFLPKFIMSFVLTTTSIFMGKSYASGQADWREDIRPETGENIFSNDPERRLLHNKWCLSDPELQTGGITWKWLNEAFKSCMKLQKTDFLKSIDTHCLIATAGQDALVDNNATDKIIANLPNAHSIEFSAALHELLMEKDEFREPLLSAFQTLVKEHIIDNPEALKTF